MKNALSPLAAEAVAALPPLRLVALGHVDHGKSTLVGRLLHDTGTLPDGKLQAIEASCKKRGLPFEWAFVTDALQAERDQNVTIETTHIRLKGARRDTVIIDAPGHREFLKNMVTGASAADAALLLVDAREGVSEQTRCHAQLVQLLGIKQVLVLVNKMDAVTYEEKVFTKVAESCHDYLKGLGITPREIIPISAREGDNVIAPSPRMPWYKGKAALAAIDMLEAEAAPLNLPLRFPVQDVYKLGDKRIIAGRIETGKIAVGDTLVFSPGGAEAKILSLEGTDAKAAEAGESIGFTLDKPVFVERGQVASHNDNLPMLTTTLRGRIFWLGKTPLSVGSRVRVRLATIEAQAELKAIERVIDSESLKETRNASVGYGAVADITLRLRGQIAVDDFHKLPALGRFVIVQESVIMGGGIVLTEGLFDQREARSGIAKSKNISEVDFGITREARTLNNGHKGGILWLTGLSSAGKSTIARLAQKRLFEKGCQVFVLDGDNIRHGLSRDLGFSAEDRSENIRRVAETAALFAEAGVIVIAAFIAPYREDRQRAQAIAPDDFHLVYIKASVDTCAKRDPKGLYEKARAGKIADFTGVNAPYEEPQMPDLLLDTEKENAESCAGKLVEYISQHLIEPVN